MGKPPLRRLTPHRMQVEHGRLQLSQLDGRDANRPDVAQLVVTAVLLHGRHLWSHPKPSQSRVRAFQLPSLQEADELICPTVKRRLLGEELVSMPHTHQYGVPMKDFLLAIVAVILAATPKSAATKIFR